MPLLVLAVAAVALYVGSRLVLASPCWAVVLLAAAVAWPMWLGQREYALFQHRLALGAATLESSRVRRWLWRGRLTSLAQAFSAFFWAAVLLALAPLLDTWHLALLAADVVVLAFFVRLARRLLESDIRAEYVGLLSRRWLLTIFNMAFLAATFFIVDYFVVGAADTRALAWDAVASRAYGEYASASCGLVAMVVGALNAADRLTWHAAEVLIPGLPGSGLRFAAWLVFLLQAGAIAFAYTRYLLGALALTARPADGIGPTPVAAIAVALLIGSWALRGFNPEMAAPVARALVHRLDPCRLADAPIAATRKSLDAQIATAAAADRAHAATRIDQALDTLFANAEKGVDSYLDWYFSVLGEYQRIAAYVGTQFLDAGAERVESELEARLFGGVPAVPQLVENPAPQLAALATQLGARLRNEASSQPCLRQALDPPRLATFERDVTRASVAVTGGIGVGLATSRVAARRVSQAAAARLASKRAAGTAAGAAARVAGKRVGSALASGSAAAALCAPGGPLSLLCAVVAGTATWIGTDKAMVMVDELRFRDEMRAEILDAVRNQKAELARELRAAHDAAIDASARALQAALDGVFIPARDGA